MGVSKEVYEGAEVETDINVPVEDISLRTSLCGPDFPTEDVLVKEVSAEDIPIEDMMSTQGLYALAEDVPSEDLLGGNVLGKDMLAQQGHPSKEIMSRTDMSLTGTSPSRMSSMGTSLLGTWCPHRDIISRTFCP